jgi:hypothetical protein
MRRPPSAALFLAMPAAAQAFRPHAAFNLGWTMQ